MKLGYLFLFAFTATFIFAACSDDNKEISGDNGDEKKVAFVGISPMEASQDEDQFPFSWNDIHWKYEDGELVGYTPNFGANVRTVNVVEYTANRLEAEGRKKTSYEEEMSSNVVELENGLVKKHILFTGSDRRNFYSFDYAYNYNADGYLKSVKGTTINGLRTEETEFLLTWENDNLVKVIVTEDNTVSVTYTYTYDDKAYVPMSDFSVYTPLSLYVPYPIIEFYTKMGKQSKNNIIEVNIDYNSSGSYSIVKLTYQTELNEVGAIKQINHTGIYNPHFSAENQDPISFKGLRTVFSYEATK